MRVLVLPLNYDHPQLGMISAFQHAFGSRNVDVFDYLAVYRGLGEKPELRGLVDDGFLARVRTFQPDWIFAQLQETDVISPAALAAARHAGGQRAYVTHWTGDYRPQLMPYTCEVSRACDLTMASSRGQLVDFTKAGSPDVMYVQIGLDWDEDVLGLPPWTPPFAVPEVVFLGNHYAGGPWVQGTAERLAVAQALQQAFGWRFGVVGHGWLGNGVNVVGTCTVKQQHHVWKRAKVAINVNHENHVANYYSDRLLIAMASGTPVVTWRVPGLEDEFVIDEDLLVATSPDGFVAATQRLLADPYRHLVGANGRDKVMREHSWYARLLQILPEIEDGITRVRSRRP